MLKPLYKGPIPYGGDTSTPIGCAGQHTRAAMDEGHMKNDIFRDWMSCCVLERSVHEVVGVERIPVDPVIQVGHREHLLVWRNSRTAST
jgi:hypothetical protein